MLRLQAERRDIDLEKYKLRHAKDDDCGQFISESVAVYEGDTLKIVYEELDWDCSDVVEALQTIQFTTSARTSGMLSTSRVFGFEPRKTIRKDFCSATALSRENPEAHDVVASYASKVAERYEKANPGLYSKHAEEAEKLIADYKVKSSIFTSGIINKDNQLLYHFDAGNVRNVWSAMLVFKKDIGGGYLAVPEYDMTFELKNNSLLMFDGQGLLHGVTPIRKKTRKAFRYSIVYYSLKQMWNCLPVDDELTRIRKKKTEREFKRLEVRGKEDFK